MKARLITMLGALIVAVGMLTGPVASPAFASTPEQCDDGVPASKCLNLWNGAGGSGYINAYTSGVANDNVRLQFLPGRCNSIDGYDSDDYQTANNCPYNGVPAGLLVFQMVDGAGQCLGDYGNSSTDARLGGFDTCNNTGTGFGGGWGTVFFIGPSYCGIPGPDQYASFHWPNGGVGYNDSNGSAVYENVDLANDANCISDTSF